MKWILPMNQPFKNLEEYASIYGQSLAINANSTEEKVDLGNTQEDQIRDDGFYQFHRFQKKGAKKWQISFQKYFLAQHTTTFKKQLQNFLEYGLSRLKEQNSKQMEVIKSDYLRADQTVAVFNLLEEEKIPTSAMHMDHFKRSRHEWEDLQNFLNQVLRQCNNFLSRELIAIAIQLWIQFRNVDFKFLERKELLQKSNQWVETYGRSAYQRDGFTYLNWKVCVPANQKRQTDIPKAFANFLRYYSTTVLLIMAGYFQNPYTDDKFDFKSETVANYPKRQLSFFGLGFWSNQSDLSDSEQSFQVKKHRKQS